MKNKLSLLKRQLNFAKATKLKFSINIRIEKCKTKCLIFSKKGLIIMK